MNENLPSSTNNSSGKVGRKLGPTMVLVAIGASLGGTAGWLAHKAMNQATPTQDAESLLNNDDLKAAQAPIDTKLLKWEQIGTIDTQLAYVRSMTLLPNGGLAVVGEQLLRIFPPADAHTNTTLAAFHDVHLDAPATAVTVDREGHFYVGSRDQISIFDSQGKLLSTFKLTNQATAERKSYITCISVGESGIYVADAGQRVVQHYDQHGKLLAEFGKPNPAEKNVGLIIPSAHLDVALVEKPGAVSEPIVWISNPGKHQLAAYNPQGKIIESWGKPGTTIETFFGCCNPTDFALFPDGRFVTAEKGVPRVKVYSPDGTLESVIAGPDQFSADAAGIDVAVDPLHADRVWILDPSTRQVRIYHLKEAH